MIFTPNRDSINHFTCLKFIFACTTAAAANKRQPLKCNRTLPPNIQKTKNNNNSKKGCNCRMCYAHTHNNNNCSPKACSIM